MSDSIQQHLDAMDGARARMDERIERLEQLSPAPEDARGPAEPAPIFGPCPICKSEMEPGRVAVHGTFWGALLVGMSYQHCWFQPLDGRPEIVVVDSGGAHTGCRCPQCGFVGIHTIDAGRALPRPWPRS